MNITLAGTGEPVELGRTVQATTGPYRGTWWVLVDVHRTDSGHRVVASRPHRVGRHVIRVAPAVFGLIIDEVISWGRHALNTLNVWRQTMGSGVAMGLLALIPLALYEAIHGGELTRHILLRLLGGKEE